MSKWSQLKLNSLHLTIFATNYIHEFTLPCLKNILHINQLFHTKMKWGIIARSIQVFLTHFIISNYILQQKYVHSQGRRKVKKSEGARSNTRLFDGTGFIANFVKIWGGSCPPCPPSSAGPGDSHSTLVWRPFGK